MKEVKRAAESSYCGLYSLVSLFPSPERKLEAKIYRVSMSARLAPPVSGLKAELNVSKLSVLSIAAEVLNRRA